MIKLLLSVTAGVGVLVGTTLLLLNSRKAELSYALPPPPLHGDPIHRCYPTTFDPPQEVRYVQAEDGYRYYEAIARSRDRTLNSPETLIQSYTTLYLRTDADSCKWLNRKDLNSGRLAFMPKSAAIAQARQQLWLELTEQLKSCSIGEVEQIIASGGNAYYWAKELDKWLGARLEVGGNLLAEMQSQFPDLQGSPLIYRGADCYRFWRSLPGMSLAILPQEVIAHA